MIFLHKFGRDFWRGARFGGVFDFMQNIKRLSAGLLAIALTSGILLWADRESRHSADQAALRSAALPRVAIVQYASIEALEQGVAGVRDALAQRGFEDGKSIELVPYNAESDFATANTIAKSVVNDRFDLIVTSSTISMQTVAAANRQVESPRRHLFGVVTDPFGSGIGVSREHPLEHPVYLAGIGSSPPVRELFEMVQRINPAAKNIGLVWNPAEASSEAATLLARQAAKDLGLVLLEGNAENATAAGTVTESLLARGIDFLWLSTDVTTITAQDVMIKAATRSRIPVISSIPDSVQHGALLALGSSYYDIGFEQGNMAADILQGRDPATIPVINWTPATMSLDLNALKGLRDKWEIPPDLVSRAAVVIDASGTHDRNLPPPAVPAALEWIR